MGGDLGAGRAGLAWPPLPGMALSGWVVEGGDGAYWSTSEPTFWCVGRFDTTPAAGWVQLKFRRALFPVSDPVTQCPAKDFCVKNIDTIILAENLYKYSLWRGNCFLDVYMIIQKSPILFNSTDWKFQIHWVNVYFEIWAKVVVLQQPKIATVSGSAGAGETPPSGTRPEICRSLPN
jgi:hypothetical protein